MLESHAASADERMPRMSNVVKVKERAALCPQAAFLELLRELGIDPQ